MREAGRFCSCMYRMAQLRRARSGTRNHLGPEDFLPPHASIFKGPSRRQIFLPEVIEKPVPQATPDPWHGAKNPEW